MTFYDRVDELEALTTAVETPRPRLLRCLRSTTRRQDGSPKKLCQNRPDVYHLAEEETESHQLEKFVEQVADHFDDRVPRIDDWAEAFGYPMEQL